MSERIVVSSFGRPRNPRFMKAGALAVVQLYLYIFIEFVLNLPRVFKLIELYRFKKFANSEPRVVYFSDNLDELNGIAVNSRLVLNEMRRQGRDFHLFGTAFHTKEGGFVEDNGAVLLPQAIGMQQIGYEDSEMAVPSLREICILLRRYPIDLIEFETPSAGALEVLLLCRLLGIKCLSHYRTDMLYYTELLSGNFAMTWFMKWYLRFFHQLAKPCIVPSSDFQEKMVSELWLKPNEVIKVDRGVALDRFSHELDLNLWPGNRVEKTVRFVYVGRVSREKELDFLGEVWKKYRRQGGQGELTIVGHGPYLEELKGILSSENVFFTGRMVGDELASLYAEADFFVFPSGSDTFGNVVVEALASGTPALVSDSGGPRDIVVEGECGWILPFHDESAWLNALQRGEQLVLRSPSEYEMLKENSVNRSKKYTLENSAKHFWSVYERELSQERVVPVNV